MFVHVSFYDRFVAKKPSRYLALLRGINVGGKNILLKDNLKQCFEGLGFSNVRTYIQSGNILFRSSHTNVKRLEKRIENGLADGFSITAQAVVLSQQRYVSAIEAAPRKWGKDDLQKHNALFVLGDITPEDVIAQLPPPKKNIETITTGPGVLFWSVSKEQSSKTTLMKLPSEPVYQQLTVRNHNTVFKLQDLFEDI